MKTSQSFYHYRPILIVVFAIALLWVASVSSGQSPSSTGQVVSPTGDDPVEVNNGVSLQLDGIRKQSQSIHSFPSERLAAERRPRYAELFASLSNFDADAEPDGWRAEVILRDENDRPVRIRAIAKFELMPRVSTADHHHFVDADMTPITWSMPLEFDKHGVASVKLPLRDSLRPILGWNSAISPSSRWPSRSGQQNHTRFSRSRTISTTHLADRMGSPSGGELRVRVSVPSEGVFAAAIPVIIRPSAMLDTHWPYR